MKLFEHGAVVLIAALIVVLVGITISDPPAQATSAPKASLRLSAALPIAPKRTLLDRGSVLDRAIARATTRTLSDTFDTLGYDLDSVLSGNGRVPRIFFASLPLDLAQVREVRVRKSIFFKAVLPLILQINEETLAQRKRVWDLSYRMRLGQRLDAIDSLWLTGRFDHYGVAPGDVDGLLNRMDIIPPSLALAQSAEESGWGTSRFVREGNALFGQWVFSTNRHMTPAQRDKGKTHRVKAFGALIDSVRAYADNLNTHRAYAAFRRDRANMRARGRPIDGMALAGRLTRYSERGQRYVKTIRSIISVNRLRHLDDARLHDGEPGADPVI
ncbi:MAG: glucosaminidase domain-containing protein [Rhodospirillales bacterium]|nr:glucosaminidase domain-containing protein [Rhodospirillales bacterium]MDP6883086.1 glucosaminidase domain-containing protein [Rhodospirillales bacterium]